MDRIKVVHLITLLEMGGAQGNTIYTVDHLPSAEFDVQLWCGRGAYWDKAVQGRARFFPCLVRSVNPILDLVAIAQLWWAFKRHRPEILHTHSSKAGILGRVAAHLARVPIVIHTFHGFGFNDQQKPWVRSFFVWLEKKVAGFATKLVFVSHSNMEEARALGIGNPRQYTLIRSGVPLELISRTARQADRNRLRAMLGIPLDAALVTTVGPFKPQKNLTDFLQMAGAVSKRNLKAHFLIIGDGAQRTFLEKMTRDFGISHRVSMPGWREDVVSYLAVSDIFVMTSLWEGLPRSLVEALQAGVPALCYQTDGVKDLFGPDDPNTVPRKDWRALAQRVQQVLSDPDESHAWSVRGKTKITRDFDIDVMVEQQRKLYLELLRAEK